MMSPQTSTCSVLLVDDSRQHCRLTEIALRHAQPATRCVSLDNGEEAIRRLGGREERPELLLLDWRMPGCSGEQVLAWARAQPHLNGLPILIVSGAAFPEDRRRAAELGADGYLLKPNNFDGYQVLARQVDDWRNRFATVAAPAALAEPAPTTVPGGPGSGAVPTHWERSARVLRALAGSWARMAAVRRRRAEEASYIEQPVDQLTADLVRLCRAQGILPRDILQSLPAGASDSPLAAQRRTVLRGLARRGWDTHELAEIFPLTPAAIRLLVRRR